MPTCPSCTAAVDPGEATCPYCGSQMAAADQPPAGDPSPDVDPAPVAPAPERGSQSVVVDDEGKLQSKGSGQAGFGREMKTFSCSSCGAKVSYDPALATLACAYCGSNYVIENQTDEKTERPSRVAPFVHAREKAEELFWKWLGKGFFRPRDLTKKSTISDIKGMYMPFFAFDADAESNWSADAGYHYTVQESYSAKDEKGNSVTKHRNVQKTRWEPASGRHAAHYEDWLVSASKGLDQEWLRKIEPFDLVAAKPYSADYLAGFAAENPSIDGHVAQDTARVELNGKEERACGEMVPGDTQRNLQVRSVLRNWNYDLALLPLWIAAYRYKGEVYRFLVNGQTGEVQGSAPFSYLKLVVVILLAAGVIGGGVLLYQLFGR
jgi:DNA-directed RNA polymerase subunit RPC12/RpoP